MKSLFKNALMALADGNLAGVGDIIVTRKNNRLLRAGREFVRNGDLWAVEARHPDGSLDVRHVDHDGRMQWQRYRLLGLRGGPRTGGA